MRGGKNRLRARFGEKDITPGVGQTDSNPDLGPFYLQDLQQVYIIPS